MIMMKNKFKLLFYILMTFSILSCKEAKPQVTFKTHVDKKLKKYVDEFISEGRKRGFDATPYLKIIDSIRINPDMEYGYLGLYTPKNHPKFRYFYGTVDISPINESDDRLLRRTVFHELAHVCGYKGHPCDVCGDILSSVTSLKLAKKGGDLYGISWDVKVDTLFSQIKSIPREDNIIRKYIESLNLK